MKKVLLSFFALFIAIVSVNAQAVQEVVHLKNGSVIRGVVIEQIPNKSVKVQTSDGSIFVYEYDDIEKISKEVSQRKDKIKSHLSNDRDISGYRGYVDFGYVFGTGTFKDSKMELTTSHGYQINNHFFLGGGVGVNYLFGSEKSYLSQEDIVILPVFANFRAYLLNGDISPFFDFKGGYSFVVTEMEDEYGDKLSGGLYVAPSLGVRFFMPNSNVGLNFSVGFNIQKLSIKDDFDRESFNNNGVNLKLGVEF